MIDFIEYLFLIFQVFTWHGATIELEGKKELAYVADEVFIYLKKIYSWLSRTCCLIICDMLYFFHRLHMTVYRRQYLFVGREWTTTESARQYSALLLTVFR